MEAPETSRRVAFPPFVSSSSSNTTTTTSSSSSLSSAAIAAAARKRPIAALTRQLSNASTASSAGGGGDADAAGAGAEDGGAEDGGVEDGPRDKMTIIPLGGGQEVGRSCIVVQYRGKTIMLDCGLHTQRVGHEAMPFFDYFDLETVDLLLVTHFHMDHVASLPYLTEKTMFTGRIFMTHPTKAITRLLLQDFVRKSAGDGGGLYDEADVDACLAKCEVIDTHQTVEHRGIRFRAYTAGHVLGACMFMLEIGGVNVLYTGDYSMEEDRHLKGAEIPSINPDVLIVESTFGIAEHGTREERERRFTTSVEEIVSKQHGACLIPVFALGRAQELLLLLDEYWQANHHLQSVPVYYANGLSRNSLRVYQTYINMMNDHIRKRQLEQPFRFRHISMLKHDQAQQIVAAEGGRQQPCVVLATNGTLEGGLSLKLLEQWCDNKKNGVVLTGFLPEGTTAKRLTRTAADSTLPLRGGGEKPVQCRVDEVTFAAHVDFAANYDFISRVRPHNIVLVHGEARTMDMLKTELVRRTMTWEPANERPSIYDPANVTLEVDPYTYREHIRGQVNLKFARQKRAKVVGRLADALADGSIALGDEVPSAVLVSKDFNLQLMAPSDVPHYAPLHLAGLCQRLHVPFAAKPPVLVALLRRLFDDVQVVERGPDGKAKQAGGKQADWFGGGGDGGQEDDGAGEEGEGGEGRDEKPTEGKKKAAARKKNGAKKTEGSTAAAAAGDGGGHNGGRSEEQLPEVLVTVSSSVRVVLDSETLPGAALLEWDASPAADLVADAVVSAAMHAQSSPHALLMTASAPGAAATAAEAAAATAAAEAAGAIIPRRPQTTQRRGRGGGSSSRGGRAAMEEEKGAEEDEEEDEALDYEDEDEEEQDEVLEDDEDGGAAGKAGGGRGPEALDDGGLDREQRLLAASRAEHAAAEKELLHELSEVLSLRFDAVELVPDTKARPADDDLDAATATDGATATDEKGGARAAAAAATPVRWALRVREEVVRGAIAAVTEGGRPPPPEGCPYTVICVVRWLRSGLAVESLSVPEGAEIDLHQRQQQIQHQFMLPQADGTFAVNPSQQLAYNEAAAVVTARAQELGRWEARQKALSDQLQAALAHAVFALRPVRSDAAWPTAMGRREA